MRIATWNIDGVNAHLGALLRWLRERKPDIVALQKIRAPEERFPTATFDREGYHAEVHCYPKTRLGFNDLGVAILSRKNRPKPPVVQKGLLGQKKLGARLLTVEFDGLEFSSVYAPFGKKENIQPKLAWYASLTALLRATHVPSRQRVLCGDFNVVPKDRVGPNGPVKGSPAYHKDVRKEFAALLEGAGLIDLYMRQPSPWDDPFIFRGRQGHLKFSRLEYVLGTQCVVDRDPVAYIDFDYSIIKTGLFYWVRAPIVVDFRE